MIYELNYHDISHQQKFNGIEVISHELSHQLFGNAVTCEWWSYNWLNEGFATLFEFHLADILYPYWNPKHFFNLRKLQNAFRLDSREETRSMTSEVTTPLEIKKSLDYVIYDKSGSVLRMFQNSVGEEIFTSALKLYLETK
jgi:aminopeptidase N